jgi:signal transduction histidine kinase
MTLALASSNPLAPQPAPLRLAHDIRNMLATIALHLETLDRLAGPPGAKAASAAHALVTKAGTLCSDVVLEAANLDVATRRAGFDVVAVIRQTCDILAPLTPKNFAIKIVGDSPTMVLGNAQEVFRIMFNLAHNAVMVARRTQRLSQLEFIVERTAATVMIRVADDGPGLPKPVHAQLFSRPSGRAESNGYGLAIARELAERNGGMLEFDGESRGTAFVLTLSALAMAPVRDSPVTRLMGRKAMTL